MLIKNPEAFKAWLFHIFEPMFPSDPEAIVNYIHALVERDKPTEKLRKSTIAHLKVFLKNETRDFVDLMFTKLQEGFKDDSTVVKRKEKPNDQDSCIETPVPPSSMNLDLETIPLPADKPVPVVADMKPTVQLPPAKDQESEWRGEPLRWREVSMWRNKSPPMNSRNERDRRMRSGSNSPSPRSYSGSPSSRYRNRSPVKRSRSRSHSPYGIRLPSEELYLDAFTREKLSLVMPNKPEAISSKPLSHALPSTFKKPKYCYTNSPHKSTPMPGWATPTQGGLEDILVPLKNVVQRCRDFHEKGICMRGDMCPYDHGKNPVVLRPHPCAPSHVHAPLAPVDQSLPAQPAKYNPDAPTMDARMWMKPQFRTAAGRGLGQRGFAPHHQRKVICVPRVEGPHCYKTLHNSMKRQCRPGFANNMNELENVKPLNHPSAKERLGALVSINAPPHSADQQEPNEMEKIVQTTFNNSQEIQDARNTIKKKMEVKRQIVQTTLNNSQEIQVARNSIKKKMEVKRRIVQTTFNNSQDIQVARNSMKKKMEVKRQEALKQKQHLCKQKHELIEELLHHQKQLIDKLEKGNIGPEQRAEILTAIKGFQIKATPEQVKAFREPLA